MRHVNIAIYFSAITCRSVGSVQQPVFFEKRVVALAYKCSLSSTDHMVVTSWKRATTTTVEPEAT